MFTYWSANVHVQAAVRRRNRTVRLIRRRTWDRSRRTSNPATRACPASALVSVARMRTVVVLPAPLRILCRLTRETDSRAARRRQAVLVPSPVLGEIGYLLQSRVGPQAEDRPSCCGLVHEETRTVLTLDDEPLGEFGEASVNVLRSKLSVRPAAVTFRRTILATDYDQFLLSVESFDRTEHAEFADLLRHRLGLEIHYESLYGGEGYKTERKPHPRAA